MHPHRTFPPWIPTLVLLLAGCAVSQVSPATSQPVQPISPAPATVGGAKPSGEILFTSERDGNSEIFLMSAEGGGAVNLTRNPAWDSGGSWSPDGQRIAFVSERTGKPELFAIDADGSNLLQLTADTAGEGWWPPASWSPDGARLLVTRSLTHSEAWAWTQAQIQVVEADGSGWRDLYPQHSMAHNDWGAEWLPGGNQVDFLTFRYTTTGVFTVTNIGGPAARLFVRGNENVVAFASSPNGNDVALVTISPDQSLEYHTALHHLVRAGLQEMAVPNATHLDGNGDFNLAWSPSSDRIAFPATELHGRRELWVWFVEFPGDLDRNLVAMTDLGGVHGRPTWSSDGEWVAFAAEVDGEEEIYLVRVGLSPVTAGATALLRLTFSEGRDYDPAWRP